MVKKPPVNAGDKRNPESGRSSGGRHVNPLQYSVREQSHGQRSLVGYSPWGHKESDMTERLRIHIGVISGVSMSRSQV